MVDMPWVDPKLHAATEIPPAADWKKIIQRGNSQLPKRELFVKLHKIVELNSKQLQTGRFYMHYDVWFSCNLF